MRNQVAPNNIQSNTRRVRPVPPRALPPPPHGGENGPPNGESLPVTFLGPNQQTGPTVAELRPLLAQGIVTQLCLWGEQGALSVLRQRFRRVVRQEHLRHAVYKIDRVEQPNGQPRFDLFVSSAAAQELLHQVKAGSQAQHYRWYCRPHIPFRDRTNRATIRGGPVGTPNEDPVQQLLDQLATTGQGDAHTNMPVDVTGTHGSPPRQGSLRVISYNINGVAQKRTELRVFLEQTQCDVLGLQETLLRATDWHLRIPQYTCYTAMGDLMAATRGVALVISKKYASNPVGKASPYWVFARIYGRHLAQPILVGSVYVPHQHHRRRVLSALPLTVASLKADFPDDPLILMGDFNMELQDVQREMTTWPYPCQALANYGRTPTRRRGRTAIDHIAYWGHPAMGQVLPPRVLQDWDLSDHYPVLARFPSLLDRAPEATQPAHAAGAHQKILVHRPEIREGIACANYWAPLASEFEDAADSDSDTDLATDDNSVDMETVDTRRAHATLERLTQRWTETCHQVASDLALHAKSTQKATTVSKSISRAVKRRRKHHCQLQAALRAGDQLTIETAQQTYRESSRLAKKAIRRARGKAWYRKVYKAHAQMIHRPREFWHWSSQYGGWRTKGGPAALQPVYGEDGTLLTDLTSIVGRWASHYAELGRDVTGHSRDMEYWQFMDPEPRTARIDELNNLFTREEVWGALGRMKRHKAPGKDGIPADFLQACLREKGTSAGPPRQDPPSTPMTDALLALLNTSYKSHTIPLSWEESIVVSLPKDGDLADPGNYRGISLMPTTLKVITVILASRISEAGETRKLFSPTQAGFRRLEEAVTQAACVIDILQRRRIAGHRTFATFIDLKKAYDTVPHGALFAKLSRFGIHGRCLAFLKGLYACSKISVRVGVGAEAQYSDPFPLHRGLRQG
jgi:exonuclease III